MTQLDWWPEPDTEADWHWADETMKVVRKVARNKRSELYRHDSYSEARDDLESWLIVQAISFRDIYQPPRPDAPATQVLDLWLRGLHSNLRKNADWHFDKVFRGGGLHGRELHWVTRTTDRIERPLGDDGEGSVVDHAGALWPTSEFFMDPLLQHVRRDGLEELLLSKYGLQFRNASLEQLLRELDTLVDRQPRRPGQCGEFGCMGEIYLMGLCSKHYEALRRERADPCSVDGCNNPAKGKGMCAGHYGAWRQEHTDPCTIEGCDKRSKSKGLCNTHYMQAYRARHAS